MHDDKKFRPEDFSEVGPDSHTEIPVDVRDMEPIEQAEWAVNALARGLGDLPEVAKVLERKRSIGRLWVRLRITPENEESWCSGPAFKMTDRFQDAPGVEFCCARQVVRVTTPLGQKKPVYGWFVAVGTTDLPGFIRAVSEVLYDPSEKLLVSASPLLGPGTPVGSILVKGGRGTRGALSTDPKDHGFSS